METHFPRERGRAGRRKEARRFGGGHSNNDSIHSFTPTQLLLLSLPTSISTYTVYFPWTHHHHYAPSLAHNHSTFMEMCVIALRFIRTNKHKQTGFGVGGTRPTRYYWYSKASMRRLDNTSVWLLLLPTITYYTHLNETLWYIQSSFPSLLSVMVMYCSQCMKRIEDE